VVLTITGESTKETVKTIAQGRPGVSGKPVVTRLVCLFHFAREAAGAVGTRLSRRPLCLRGQKFLNDSGASRERGCVSRRHCEGRKRRSNPFFFAAKWIASRSMSSGARSRDPLARNDGLWLFDNLNRTDDSVCPGTRLRRLRSCSITCAQGSLWLE
jgi:hypothetical protein